MLSFTNVTKDFQLDETTKITPVRNISLRIEPGEFVIIVGRSGTGKTTLLNLAAGMMKPTTGQVKFDNVDLAEMNQKQISSFRIQKIGFIFQFPSLIPALTVKENVTLPALFSNGNSHDKIEDRAAELLSMLGLAGKMQVHPRQLSAGETKRVVIARALINQPQLILADEPTSDLDNGTEEEVMTILREINAKGVTFLMVTHSLQLTPAATRTFEMENGELTQVNRQYQIS
jgi:ABC-type lipoprotein export system ATPase subunit